MEVGFIGLGRMGRGMALNLVRKGFSLTVFDTEPEAAAVLREAGARVAADVAGLAGSSDVVFTSLPGPAQVEQVVLGEGGIVENMRAGLVLFELSTSSRELAHRLHAAFAERGGTMLDAPISGGPAGAAAGDLALWIGGDAEVVDRCADLLSAIGTPHRVGGIGAGTVTKLSHNVLGYMIMESLAEVFSLATRAGVDPLDLWQALRLGVVGKASPLDLLVKQFLPNSYDPPAFALELAHKDVRLATAMGRELGVPMRMANLTMEEMTEALGRGFAGRDSRSFLALQVERAGVEIAVDPERLQQAVDAARRG